MYAGRAHAVTAPGRAPADKLFVSAQSLLEDSARLAFQVLKDGFHPHFITGIWRGGTPVGIAVQEILDYFGVPTDHIAIRTSSYEGMDRRRASVRVHGLNYLVERLRPEHRLLLVDDVFETGLSIHAVLKALRERTGRNPPAEVRTAVVYYKPGAGRTDLVPHYHVRKTDAWIVFPHEMQGLTEEELTGHKPWILRLAREHGLKR